jgi:hypothetical protein
MPRAQRRAHFAWRSWGGDVKDAYRYYVLAYEDARHRRPIKHEYGGTTILTDSAEAYPDGWVYFHVEYEGIRSR